MDNWNLDTFGRGNSSVYEVVYCKRHGGSSWLLDGSPTGVCIFGQKQIFATCDREAFRILKKFTEESTEYNRGCIGRGPRLFKWERKEVGTGKR